MNKAKLDKICQYILELNCEEALNGDDIESITKALKEFNGEKDSRAKELELLALQRMTGEQIVNELNDAERKEYNKLMYGDDTDEYV